MNYFGYFMKRDIQMKRLAYFGTSGIIRLKAADGGRFCTMFAFQGVDDPNILHCTHKYFGDGKASKEEIVSHLEKHFGNEPFKPFHPVFDEIDHFGQDEDYRVVKPKTADDFLLGLKKNLDKIEPDKFPEYQPHVTVGRNTDVVDLPIRDYVLMDNHKPVWSAKEHSEGMRKELRKFFEKRSK